MTDLKAFDHFDIEEKLQRLFRNKIWLKSGGHLIINQTEAFVAIDVNTGKFVGAKNLEDTILKLNLEAIREIVHQIRLRDLGGIIVIDFIDMEIRANRKKVVNAFFREMKKDRALYKILPINEFGLLHLTRKRVKSSFAKMMSRHCPHCDGMGYIKSSQTICFEIIREILKMVPHLSSKKIIVRAHPEIIEMFKTEEYELIRDIEKSTRRKYILKEDRGLHHENFDIMSG
jgi:ribonuclease G